MNKHFYEKLGVSLLVLAFSFFNLQAFGNSGPVRQSDAGPLGGFAPTKPAGITLIKENLTLRIPDPNTYDAEALYFLNKTDAGASVITLGLPIGLPHDINDPVEPKQEMETAAKVAKTVEISVGKESFACQLASVIESAKFPRRPITKDLKVGYIGETMLQNQQWCIAQVKLPASTGPLEIKLKYKASLILDDSGTSKSPFTDFTTRILYYPLFPALPWASESFLADVSLQLGPFSGDVLKSSPASAEKDGFLRWTLKKRDLENPLMVELGTSNLQVQEILSWNRIADPNERLDLVASSNVKLEKYPPSLAVDGKAETAWCFRDKSGKPDAEIKLQLKEASRTRVQNKRCELEGIHMTTGYLKNQKIFEANGKIATAELSACDAKFVKLGSDDYYFGNLPKKDYRSAWQMFAAETTDEWLLAAKKSFKDGTSSTVQLPPKNDLTIMLKSGCLKIRITKTRPGPARDTCVSEIVPIVGCFGRGS